jgi:transcription elongation factor Elf1
MPKLTCPGCGHQGEVRGTDEHFEPRGQWPEGHKPVRKCRACGGGIIVRFRFLIFRPYGERIPDDLWANMDRHFQREVYGIDPDKPFVCTECGKSFVMQAALDNHARDVHA